MKHMPDYPNRIRPMTLKDVFYGIIIALLVFIALPTVIVLLKTALESGGAW